MLQVFDDVLSGIAFVVSSAIEDSKIVFKEIGMYSWESANVIFLATLLFVK